MLRLTDGVCSGVAVTEEARVDGLDVVGDDMVRVNNDWLEKRMAWMMQYSCVMKARCLKNRLKITVMAKSSPCYMCILKNPLLESVPTILPPSHRRQGDAELYFVLYRRRP